MQQIECSQLIVDYGRISILESKERTKRDAVKFIKAVIENVKARFPDNELVEASNIFDPKSLPTSDTDCATYGERELELLTGHYSTFVDSSLCS